MYLSHATPDCTGRWVQLGSDESKSRVIACITCQACFERTQEIAEQAKEENDLTLEIEFLAMEGEIMLRDAGR